MNCCFNCQSSDTVSNPVETHMIEGRWTPVCDECMSEIERLETQADQLAALPSCDYRQMLIDRAQTTRELVNTLKAHDQQGCMLCKPVERIAAQSERGGQRKEEVA